LFVVTVAVAFSDVTVSVVTLTGARSGLAAFVALLIDGPAGTVVLSIFTEISVGTQMNIIK
jgi:hypothetical protein